MGAVVSEHVCYGCSDSIRTALGHRTRSTHEFVFTDSRTGRGFCHECAAALISWELDGRPEADEPDCGYPEWLGEREPDQ